MFLFLVLAIGPLSTVCAGAVGEVTKDRPEFSQVELDSCTEELVAQAQPRPHVLRSMFRWVKSLNKTQISIIAGAIGLTSVGGVSAWKYLENHHDLRLIVSTLVGMRLMEAGWDLFTTLLGPQYDFWSIWKKKIGYALNLNAKDRLIGRRSLTGWFGDATAPDLNQDFDARMNAWQQTTACRLGNMDGYMGWLGHRIPLMLEKGDLDVAAHLLAGEILHVAFREIEILKRTDPEHLNLSVRSVCLVSAKTNLLFPMVKFFKGREPQLHEFTQELKLALKELELEHPDLYAAYHEGVRIFFQEWMTPFFKSRGLEFDLEMARR